MILSQWRSSLKTWLQSHTTITTWDIIAPEVGQLTGFLPPLENIDYRNTDDDLVIGSASQDVYLRRRYGSNPRYESLPIADLEDFHATLAYRMVRQYQSINPGILRLDFERVSNPVVVEEGGNGDFIVTLHLRMSIEWVVELATPDPAFDLNSITLNLWRQKGNEFLPDERTKDYTIGQNY